MSSTFPASSVDSSQTTVSSTSSGTEYVSTEGSKVPTDQESSSSSPIGASTPAQYPSELTSTPPYISSSTEAGVFPVSTLSITTLTETSSLTYNPSTDNLIQTQPAVVTPSTNQGSSSTFSYSSTTIQDITTPYSEQHYSQTGSTESSIPSTDRPAETTAQGSKPTTTGIND